MGEHAYILSATFLHVCTNIIPITVIIVITIMDRNKYVFFHALGDENEEFNQWYVTTFNGNGGVFVSVEQFVAYSKAVFFNDIVAAKIITSMFTADASVYRSIATTILGFNKARWDIIATDTFINANYFKFVSDPILTAKLINTGNKTIVNCNPNDRTWGIGFTERDAIANVNSWGSNRLGEILMVVRDMLVSDSISTTTHL